MITSEYLKVLREVGKNLEKIDKQENMPDLSFSDSGDENYLWNYEIEYTLDF
jgi:hypothetical protein